MRPMVRAMATAMTPTSSEMRVATRTRENRSRPRESVPNRCDQDGGDP
jgi:hypothetical protein